MRRIVSVWLPSFAIERLRRADGTAVPDERPFALVANATHGLRLTALNEAAARHGLAPGLALADARAVLPGLVVREAEPARDQAALLGLARWCGRYGPARNVEGVDGLWIDVTGVAHLFAASTASGEARERALAHDLVARLAGQGLTARVGLADTPGAAHALARFASGPDGRIAVAPPGATRAALAGLPVEALRLEPETALLLRRLGLARIGQLYDVPRASLERRFRASRSRRGGPLARAARRRAAEAAGLAFAVVGRLDAALGFRAEPLRALSEPPVLAARQAFAEPLVSSEGLEAAAAGLAAELAARLDAAGLGARRVHLALYRCDGTVAEVRVGFSRPCREPGHVVRLLRERLGTVDAGFGIDAAVLEAVSADPLAPAQTVLAEVGLPARDGVATLVDTLTNRLGAGRVVRLVSHASHVPERAQIEVPALSHGPEAGAGKAAPIAPARSRPALLLAPPEPIAVMAEVPEGAPLGFIWRRIARRIVRAEGPERIAPEWWLRIGRGPAATAPADESSCAVRSDPLADAVRDYYRLEDEAGARYWVFRAGLYGDEDADGLPRWYMHGVFA